MKEKQTELLKDLLNQTQSMSYGQSDTDMIKKRSEMLIRKIFGESSEYLNKLKYVSFSPRILWSNMDRGQYHTSFESGKKTLTNLINVMIEDLSLSEQLEEHESKLTETVLSENVFIVHGHNEEMKQATARFVEKIGLKPIILHEQASSGRTIIEKFTDFSNVGFAIVNVSADDVGYAKDDKPENAKLRARQNVIFELGYFLGKLGREKVIALHETSEDFEILSDYQGVIYIPYDRNDTWKFSIVKELKAIGYDIDANKIIQ